MVLGSSVLWTTSLQSFLSWRSSQVVSWAPFAWMSSQRQKTVSINMQSLPHIYVFFPNKSLLHIFKPSFFSLHILVALEVRTLLALVLKFLLRNSGKIPDSIISPCAYRRDVNKHPKTVLLSSTLIRNCIFNEIDSRTWRTDYGVF